MLVQDDDGRPSVDTHTQRKGREQRHHAKAHRAAVEAVAAAGAAAATTAEDEA